MPQGDLTSSPGILEEEIDSIKSTREKSEQAISQHGIRESDLVMHEVRPTWKAASPPISWIKLEGV